MEKIKFTFFDLALQEPMALVTNWLIALVCIVYFFKTEQTNSIRTNWRYFFVFMAISTLIGGIGHLFFHYTGMLLKMMAWWFSVISVYFAERTVIDIVERKSWKNFFRILLPIKLVAAITISAITQDFVWILISSAAAFVLIMLPNYIDRLKHKKDGAGYFVTGILVLLLPAFIQVFKFSPYLWLNKDDLAHLLMIVAITFFFLGTKRASKFI